MPARLFRVSFTGELGFEVNVPADHGRAVWEAIYAAGQPLGITPYGTEAMHVLRAEKGYIVVGQETDGTVTPDDVGMAWAVGKAKPRFRRQALAGPTRPCRAPGASNSSGCCRRTRASCRRKARRSLAGPDQGSAGRPLGHVTSAYASATLGRSIALAMVAGGRGRIGETLHITTSGQPVAAAVTGPVFYDPDGNRLDAA